jgi:hypothetical protein
MFRKFLLLFLFCCYLFGLCDNIAAQTNSIAATSSTPIQVVYLNEGNTIVTYNVDPQTLYATQVGSLTLTTNAEYYVVYPSPNDHFIYVVAFNTNSTKSLAVYQTDASGAPQAPPTQQVNFNYFYDMRFDPHANFAYAVFGLPNGPNQTAFHIRRYLVNQTNGSLSSPVSEAKYVLDTDPSGEYCNLGLSGFNAAGTVLYDNVSCSPHDSNSATYYERSLNTKTGALGPDVQIYSWNQGDSGFERVQFIKNLMFDFMSPNDFQTGIDEVNIYPVAPHTSTPLVHCTVNMLEACGDTTGVAHPSGKYVFMAISSDTTQIDRVELGAKKIVDTGNYIPYQFGAFSPDGTLFYGIENTNTTYIIHIYGFDVATSAVTPGGEIGLPSGLDPYFVAERY